MGTTISAGDKVRIKPTDKHFHSNQIGTVLEVYFPYPGAYDLLVELVSPTRRPSLISHTTYRRAAAQVNFNRHEVVVVLPAKYPLV